MATLHALPCPSRWAILVTVFLALSFGGTLARAQQDIATQHPELESLPDSTDDLQAAIDSNGGVLELDPKVYRITRPLEFRLAERGIGGVHSAPGAATLVMDGPGPAIRLIGSHEGTAGPGTFKPATWRERMPVVENLVILGNHPEADGIELFQCVQPVVTRISVRGCRHGIRLTTRNRNVTISDCHLYENEGVGLYLDDVNLHQINVSNCHISYNRAGGIVVRDGNVRNLHITGCDLEANMPDDTETRTRAANILIDVSGSPEDRTKSIAEIAITGCTIQHSANYGGDQGKTVAPGGANIRLAGKDLWPIDSVAITGNVISDTSVSVDIDRSMDVTLSGNTFFAPKPAHLVVTNSQRVTVTGNTFNPRQFERPGTLRFENCRDCLLTGSSIRGAIATDGAVILEQCEGFVISALNLSECASGLVLKGCSDTVITGCRVGRLPDGAVALAIDAASRGILVESNRFHGKTQVAEEAVQPID